ASTQAFVDHDDMLHAAPQTIREYLWRAVVTRAQEPALGFIRAGRLHWLVSQQVWNAAATLAGELRTADVEPGDRVAHVSENVYEWIITDLALDLAGAVHVPIHVTLSGQQIGEQIVDSGAMLVFFSSEELVAKFEDGLRDGRRYRLHNEQAGSWETQ